MNLDIQKWKSFKVFKILSIMNGKGITTEEIEENSGHFIVVQSGEENNGVLGKINLNYCKKMNYTFTEKPCLTVARSGSAGFVSFQINGCVVGDSAKILLLDDDVATTERYVFLQSVLTANRFKYTYGRKVTASKYMNDVIDLPIVYQSDGTPFIDDTKKYSDEGYVPDWQFMDRYIMTLHHKQLSTKNKPKSLSKVDVTKWGRFVFGNLINKIYKSKAINKDDLTAATDMNFAIRYITRTSDNNGCEMLADCSGISDETIEDGNAISIGDTTATCFYQSERFITGDHMVVIRADWLNQNNALYVLSILNREQYKYSYGRAFLMDRIRATEIRLPLKQKSDGKPFIDETKQYSDEGYVPDWNYMENYIKALPYGDKL